MTSTTCTTQGWHCENCGSTDSENIDGNEGYTRCCNELVTDQHGCRDHHGQNARFQAAVDALTTAAGYGTDRDAMIDAVGLAAWDAALAPLMAAHLN